MNKLFSIVITLLGVLLAPQVMAVSLQQNELYQATVPVESQRTSERQKVLPQALEQVLIKRSGNPDIAEQGTIKQQLNDAERWVMRYQYQRTSDQQLQLRVNFSPQAVDNLLQQAGQPLWQGQRPLTLVWLAVGDDENYRLVGSLANNDVPNLLHQAAEHWGLPILLPALDLTDMRRVSASAVWDGDADQVLLASQRYAAESILLGKMVQHTDDLWEGYWLMQWNDQWLSWNTSGKSKEQVINQIMQRISETLATQSRPDETHDTMPQAVTLRVEQVHDLPSYQRVMNYLNSLSIVRTANVDQLHPNSVELQLQLSGDELALQQALSADQVLTLINWQPDGTLIYRLNQ